MGGFVGSVARYFVSRLKLSYDLLSIPGVPWDAIDEIALNKLHMDPSGPARVSAGIGQGLKPTPIKFTLTTSAPRTKIGTLRELYLDSGVDS